jgi:hypothetical protein
MISPQSARAEGLEIVLRGPAPARGAFRAGYTLARAEDEIDGRWVARSWDQRHALDLGLSWKPGEAWDLTLAGRYHSGRPTTPVTATVDGSTEIVPEIGPRNSARLPAYQRVDVRVSRSFALRGTELRTSATVTNVFDRQNPGYVADFAYVAGADGTVAVEPHLQQGLPRLLTLGLSLGF